MREIKQQRQERLLPNGQPKYIRCYDNGGADTENGTLDRYTVVFTGSYNNIGQKKREKKEPSIFIYVGMSTFPFHPQGFGQHGESEFKPIDKPTYGHLGKKIKFSDLPKDCQQLVLSDYKDIWDIN